MDVPRFLTITYKPNSEGFTGANHPGRDDQPEPPRLDAVCVATCPARAVCSVQCAVWHPTSALCSSRVEQTGVSDRFDQDRVFFPLADFPIEPPLNFFLLSAPGATPTDHLRIDPFHSTISSFPAVRIWHNDRKKGTPPSRVTKLVPHASSRGHQSDPAPLRVCPPSPIHLQSPPPSLLRACAVCVATTSRRRPVGPPSVVSLSLSSPPSFRKCRAHTPWTS
jgi:hypothetical protein